MVNLKGKIRRLRSLRLLRNLRSTQISRSPPPSLVRSLAGVFTPAIYEMYVIYEVCAICRVPWTRSPASSLVSSLTGFFF